MSPRLWSRPKTTPSTRPEPFPLLRPPCLLAFQARDAFHRQIPSGSRLLALERTFQTATDHLSFAARASASDVRSPEFMTRARPPRHPLFADAVGRHTPPVDFYNSTQSLEHTHETTKLRTVRTEIRVPDGANLTEGTSRASSAQGVMRSTE